MTEPAGPGDDLDMIAADWRDLYARCPAASPFQSPDWLIPWWRAFRPGALRIVTVRDGGRLVALAPLWLEDGALGRRLLPLGISVSDDTDVLVDPAVAGAETRLVEAVAADPSWQSWSVEDCRPDAMALTLPFSPAWTATRASQSLRPVLDLAGPRDGDGLPLSVPADRRRKVRRARRLAGEAGGVAVERDPAADDLVAHLVRLHGLRWAERGEPDGIFADERVAVFLRAALPRLQAVDLARTALIRIGGTVVGAFFGLHRGDRALAYIGGFDPARSHESPGALLIADAIVRAADEGVRWFDFLRGGEAYKYLWGAADVATTRLEIRRLP